MIKYTKNVLFLKPFVESVSHLVPVRKIKRINGYKVRKGCEELSYGAINSLKNDRYSINIKIYDLIKYKKYRGSTYSIILDTLAHELAHLKISEHSPEHYALTARINLKFSTILYKYGIIDTSMRYK